MAKPVLIDFYAEWCGPCKEMTPVIEELKARMGDRVEIRKVDVGDGSEEARQSAIKYKLQYVPTIIIERDGQVIETLVGLQSLESLQSALENLLED